MQYPGDDFDYSRRSVDTFRDFMRGMLLPAERQRIDALEAIDPFVYPNEFPDQWRQFRQSQLTALVARLRSVVKAERPSAIVSAAVTADAATSPSTTGSRTGGRGSTTDFSTPSARSCPG